MAVTATPIYPQNIINGLVQVVNADAQSLKTIYTAGPAGSKIELLIATSNDTSNRDIQLSIVNSTVTYILGTITIPLTAGTINNVVTANLLGNSQITGLPKDSNGNPYIYLASGSVLKASALTSVTAAKTISIISHGGDY